MNGTQKVGKLNNPLSANADFGSLSPVIPGALVTLIAAGNIISQEPTSWSSVVQGSRVNLVISSGQK